MKLITLVLYYIQNVPVKAKLPLLASVNIVISSTRIERVRFDGRVCKKGVNDIQILSGVHCPDAKFYHGLDGIHIES